MNPVPTRLSLIPTPNRDALIASGLSPEAADQIIAATATANSQIMALDAALDGSITSKQALIEQNRQLQEQLANSVVVFIFKISVYDENGNERIILITTQGGTADDALAKARTLIPNMSDYQVIEQFATNPDGTMFNPR